MKFPIPISHTKLMLCHTYQKFRQFLTPKRNDLHPQEKKNEKLPTRVQDVLCPLDSDQTLDNSLFSSSLFFLPFLAVQQDNDDKSL